MKNFILLIVMVLGLSFNASAKTDAQKLQEDMVKDMILLKKHMKEDRKALDTQAIEKLLGTKSVKHNDCDNEDDNVGSGSGSCWDNCDFSTSYCANLCGTSTDTGSSSCWDDCDFSTSYCADLCGTSSSTGSQSCWDNCDFSVSYCANLCGTN